MGFSSINAVNAARGLQGTSRQAATFTGTGAAAAPGMQGAPMAPAPAPMGSSYSTSGGMQNTSRGAGGRDYAFAVNGADANGVIAGQQGHMANVGQIAPQLSAAEMQDPNNAALAGFQFAQGQDQPVQASAPVYGGQQPTGPSTKPYGADAQRSAQMQPTPMGPVQQPPQQQAKGSNVATIVANNPQMKPAPQYGRTM